MISITYNVDFQLQVKDKSITYLCMLFEVHPLRVRPYAYLPRTTMYVATFTIIVETDIKQCA